MSKLLEMQTAKADHEVTEYTPDQILTVPIEDIVEDVYAECVIEPLVIHRDRAVALEPREFSFYTPPDGPSLQVEGMRYAVEYPFSGHLGLFRHKPDKFDERPPRGQAQEATLLISVMGEGLDEAHVRKELGIQLDAVDRYIAYQQLQIGPFLDGLKRRIREHIERRKGAILKARQITASLGYQMKVRNDTPMTYIVPIVRKKLVITPANTLAPFSPEPALDQQNYDAILDIIHSMTVVMEQHPDAFRNIGEEHLRSHYLVSLNSHFEGAATGETFNYQGKTDVLIRVQGRNIFVAECKFWDGEKAFAETIDQILGYLSWRDTKAAIILFNRNKNFSEVLAKLQGAAKAHPHCKRGPTVSGETRFQYVFKNPTDQNRELTSRCHGF